MTAHQNVTLEARFATDLSSLVAPSKAMPFPEAETLAVNTQLAEELGLDVAWIASPEATQWLIGGHVAPGSTPVAAVYSGHQFGQYSPRLGDGRALLLGEVRDTSGQLRDIQLKGSGRTPLSRGDGFAAVGPMLREMLIGEAMHALGIPTTRALAVTATKRHIAREGEVLPGAVLTRVAESHIRVGTFQFARSLGDLELLEQLVRFSLERHAPELERADAGESARNLLGFTIERQAHLVAQWMLVGFVHGVLNTDNVMVSGEGFDYGPCAFIDAYDPLASFSSIDAYGRYAFGRQPAITQWNLERFAEALIPLIDSDQQRAIDAVKAELALFADRFNEAYLSGLRDKLGGVLGDRDDPADADTLLLGMQAARADFTGTFRALAERARGGDAGVAGVREEWITEWLAGSPDPGLMDQVNPAVIPRNHLVEEALDAATDGDMKPFERLLEAVRHPFVVRAGDERYTEPAPDTFGRYVTFCGT